MRTKNYMKRARGIAVKRKSETERKARHKSAEKDKLTSGRREGETGVRDEAVQTDSMMPVLEHLVHGLFNRSQLIHWCTGLKKRLDYISVSCLFPKPAVEVFKVDVSALLKFKGIV